MLYSYYAKDVNEALAAGLFCLLHSGVEEQSRNGSVIVAPWPVMVTYTNPKQRVLYSKTRDANPFFHFFESLWMLAGRNDIKFPSYFNSMYGQFSDDGSTMWDAYGWRWRSFFGWDQLQAIGKELKENPTSRRCVLSMWNAMPSDEPNAGTANQFHIVDSDFEVAINGGKAVPCNTQAYFDVRGGALNMTVMNRSNDAIWGCFGANAVHFSFLLEYMAMLVGKPMGVYRQFTNNLHVYTDKFSRERLLQIANESSQRHILDPFDRSKRTTEELACRHNIEEGFDEDLPLFMKWAEEVIDSSPQEAKALDIPHMKTSLMQEVAVTMFLTWVYRKWKDDYSSNICLEGIDALDWQIACRDWIERRKK